MKVSAMFLLAVFLVACSSPDQYTVRNASRELATMYCEAVLECDYLHEPLLPACIEHSSWHLCEIQQSCGEELNEGVASELLDQCAKGLASLDIEGCYFLGYWGFLPEGCTPAYNMIYEAGL